MLCFLLLEPSHASQTLSTFCVTTIFAAAKIRPGKDFQKRRSVCLFVTAHRQDPAGTGERLADPVNTAVGEI